MAARKVSVRRQQELPVAESVFTHLQNEPAAVQAGSAAVTFVITHLRKGKNSCAAAGRKE